MTSLQSRLHNIHTLKISQCSDHWYHTEIIRTSWSLILHILHIWSMEIIKKSQELQMHKPDRHPSPKESYWYMFGVYSHWQFMLHTNCCHFYRKSFKINSRLASMDHYRVNAEHTYPAILSTYFLVCKAYRPHEAKGGWCQFPALF